MTEAAPTATNLTGIEVPALSTAVQVEHTETGVPDTDGSPSGPESITTAPNSGPVDIESPLSSKHETEPQNPLTKQFTEAEWKAMKELRKHLPEIFAEVFPEKSNARDSPVKLWGVTIKPCENSDARVSVILVKFLRARNLNVEEARTMFIATLKWRDQFKPEEAVEEDFPDDVFGKLGHVFGHDKGGRPVTYNLYGANKDLKAVFGDIPRFIRWRVALMEKGVASLDFESVDQMVQIHDYEGVTLSSRDANSKNAASEASSIFSNHYPELLYKKFFINVPTIMTWIFWVFKPLVSAQTLAKMSVVGHGNAISKALLPVIDADQLPTRYGGSAEAF